MTGPDRRSALHVRSLIERGRLDAPRFREELLRVAPASRDAWADLVLGLEATPDDGPELPRGCVPYLPCSVDALLRIVDQAPVKPTDVFVDVGAGVGRAAAVVHLITGAAVVGIEIQRALVLAARELARRLRANGITIIEGDAAELAAHVPGGSVFLLYCPFSGARLARVLAHLETTARARALRVCTVDLPLPHRAWLTLQPGAQGDLAIYRTESTP